MTYTWGTCQKDGRWVASALAAATAVALLAGGCGPGSSAADAPRQHGAGGHEQVPVSLLPSKPSEPMTVQQLASELGCKAQLAGRYADYRQAWCDLDGTKLVLLDFDTERGQGDWLEMSKWYGGVYLVGERWVLTGNTLAEISPLQDKFGGKVEQGDIHGPPPPSTKAN